VIPSDRAGRGECARGIARRQPPSGPRHSTASASLRLPRLLEVRARAAPFGRVCFVALAPAPRRTRRTPAGPGLRAPRIHSRLARPSACCILSRLRGRGFARLASAADCRGRVRRRAAPVRFVGVARSRWT
jgi:hypothetical protein